MRKKLFQTLAAIILGGGGLVSGAFVGSFVDRGIDHFGFWTDALGFTGLALGFLAGWISPGSLFWPLYDDKAP